MAYNFKSIADVDVVAEPSEAANVLIEENGVIKKAPKTAVGGAGKSEADIIFEIVHDPDNWSYNVSFVKGSYDEILNIYKNGQIPEIQIIYGGMNNIDSGTCVLPSIHNGYCAYYYGTIYVSFPIVNSCYGDMSTGKIDIEDDYIGFYIN